MDKVTKYFPALSSSQILKFEMLEQLYADWNSKINVISRKDIDYLYERHVLHSLGIAKVIEFVSGTKILDVGTGGGFPGIPLAIMFPDSHFHLVDSIGKKIKVVEGVADSLQLKNVTFEKIRAENISEKYDFIVSRAVTSLPVFCKWVGGNIRKRDKNRLKNGILYLKGGEVEDELKRINKIVTLYHLKDYFQESFFETKNIVYLT